LEKKGIQRHQKCVKICPARRLCGAAACSPDPTRDTDQHALQEGGGPWQFTKVICRLPPAGGGKTVQTQGVGPESGTSTTLWSARMRRGRENNPPKPCPSPTTGRTGGRYNVPGAGNFACLAKEGGLQGKSGVGTLTSLQRERRNWGTGKCDQSRRSRKTPDRSLRLTQGGQAKTT